MTLFQHPNILDAYAHVSAGNQAIYLRKGSTSAWLLDNNLTRLIGTAKRLGNRRIYVGRASQEGQYIEVKGRPLENALAECSNLELSL